MKEEEEEGGVNERLTALASSGNRDGRTKIDPHI